MIIESVTYRFHVAREDGWPERIHKQYSKTLEYRPDTISFEVHLTAEKGTISAGKMTVSGCRYLKAGLSDHRISEWYYSPLADWAQPYVSNAVEFVRDRNPVTA